ncbi:MAG: hypothetical protein MI919_30730, partial [Holophagales bacterium]|nr:hypothetical protein [Holophagales bacterium]
ARADLDLGFRLHSSGALLLLEPSISVLHHRAPSGGLRRHRARTVTYSDSRKRLLAFHLPSVTEIYLARRYFPQELAREAELLRLAGTFALRGHPGRRLAKVLLAALLLPVHLWKLRQARQRAGDLARRFPEIPELPERTEPPPGASV